MKWFGYEPAVLLYALNALVALLVAFGLDLSQVQVAAVTTIATALLTIAAAVFTRPVVVSTVTAALASLLTAAAAFGLHLSANQTGAVLRQNVSPAPVASRRA